MPRLHRQHYHDIELIIEFDFVRATEAAALNSLRWLGRGDKEAADAAACDAMLHRISVIRRLRLLTSSLRKIA